ncbi:hypothetical protein BRD07_04670 [Halobacteriales archaeon QS_9_68_42]|nr:MAG: hypothetical protein BRD07_04670 [Halobacteriales archaeon QS_9_68_42]
MAARSRRVEPPLFLVGVATAALLVVMLYYPVASVLAEAVLVDGRVRTCWHASSSPGGRPSGR